MTTPDSPPEFQQEPHPSPQFEQPDEPNSDAGRPAAITWLAATGTALLFAAFAIFTITQWQQWNDLIKLAVLLAATAVAFTAGTRMQRRVPVTGSALAHLGALLVPIDATALAKSMDWHWPQLLIIQGLTGVAAIVALQRRSSSVVLDYARPIAGLMVISGLAEILHFSASTVAAAVAVVLIATSHERRGALTVATVAAFAPIAAVLIDTQLQAREFAYGHGVARRLGIIDAAPTWYFATAVLAAVAFATLARQSQRLSFGAVAAGAFTLNAGMAWSSLHDGSSFKPLAFPALFVVIELLALSLQRDTLFARPTQMFARATELLLMIPSIAVAANALVTAHLSVEATALSVIVLVATGWMISLGRSVDQSEQPSFFNDRNLSAFMAIAAGISSIAALAPSRLWVAGVAATMAAATLVVHRRNTFLDRAALGTALWSIYASHTTGWIAAFAAGVVLLTATTAWQRKSPQALWFTFAAFTALETFGLSDLGINARPAVFGLCSASAVALVIAAVIPARWRQPLFAIAAMSGFMGIITSSVGAPREIGNAMFIAGIGVLAYGVLQKHAFAANSGGSLAIYGVWSNLGLHGVSQIELYMIPLALHLGIAGELYRRLLLRTELHRSISSWAAHGPALLVLLVPSIIAGIRTEVHAHLLFAGAVAIAAVAIGGIQRYAAPLLLGTAALTVITFDMTIGPASHVQSWVWLALGGSALVATAIGMERTHTSPVAAGRRLIEVVNEQFV